MSKIFILEDDAQIAKSLALSLKFAGFETRVATTLAQGRELLGGEDFDLLLLDVGLPDGTGFEFCRELRERGVDCPVLFLSARTDEQSVVEGLSVGADDYVRKPFGSEELKARIHKAMEKAAPRRNVLRVGKLKLDLGSRHASYADNKVNLGRREFDILAVMMRRPADVTTREQILAAIGDDGGMFDRTVDSHVSHLRRKLREGGCDEVQITAVYGVGYSLQTA